MGAAVAQTCRLRPPPNQNLTTSVIFQSSVLVIEARYSQKA